MIIKASSLVSSLKKGFAALYLVSGPEAFLLEQAVKQIKEAWRAEGEDDKEECILTVHNLEEWQKAFQDANTYALFASERLFDLRWDKKTLDKSIIQAIQTYLAEPNPRSLIIIQAPLLAPKLLQELAKHPQLHYIPVTSLSPMALKQWIRDALLQRKLKAEPEALEMIFHYHQSNLAACHQLIEHLALAHPPETRINESILSNYLHDQSAFSIYDLADSLLAGHEIDVIHRLRQLKAAAVEATLILWLVAKEIRCLIELHCCDQRGLSWSSACQELHIWSQKMPNYQKAFKRVSLQSLYESLEHCQAIDQGLKTNRGSKPWQQLESLCLKLV